MNSIVYECAPMDGVTDFIFRQVQSRHFGKADLYYTPFLSLTAGHGFQEREFHEMNPENNRGMEVIPQLIGNNTEDFLWGIREIADLGYSEVNINMGCPSRTVARKGKGSGMLKNLVETERILEEIFSESPIAVSLKIRIGYDSDEIFPEILSMVNRFPVKKLIIHPRIQTQGYGGEINENALRLAIEESHAPLSMSGDLFDKPAIETFIQKYPTIRTLMIGRGLVANPAMIGEARGEKPLDNERFREYHGELYEAYGKHLVKERYTIGRMKELWAYMGMAFEQPGELLMAIRRAGTLSEYEKAAARIFEECPVRKDAGFSAWKTAHKTRFGQTQGDFAEIAK